MRVPPPYGRLLVPVYAPSIVLAVSSEALLVLLPLYVIDLDHGAGLAAFVVGMRGLGILLFDVPAGALAGRFGDRPVLLGGPAAFVAGCVICAVSTEAWLLCAAALLAGAGHAAWMLGRQSYIARHVEPVQDVGFTAAPLATGALVSAASLAAASLTASRIGFAGVLLMWLVVPETRGLAARAGGGGSGAK